VHDLADLGPHGHKRLAWRAAPSYGGPSAGDLMERMQPTLRSPRQIAVIRRRRVALGCVAALLVSGVGWALAAGSGSAGKPAVPQGAPNRGSYAPDTPQRGVAVQPSQR
jgi:hypothetical protein